MTLNLMTFSITIKNQFTQHNGTFVMLSVFYAECYYAEFRYAECRSAIIFWSTVSILTV
jgi:hypothetical protein